MDEKARRDEKKDEDQGCENRGFLHVACSLPCGHSKSSATRRILGFELSCASSDVRGEGEGVRSAALRGRGHAARIRCG